MVASLTTVLVFSDGINDGLNANNGKKIDAVVDQSLQLQHTPQSPVLCCTRSMVKRKKDGKRKNGRSLLIAGAAREKVLASDAGNDGGESV